MNEFGTERMDRSKQTTGVFNFKHVDLGVLGIGTETEEGEKTNDPTRRTVLGMAASILAALGLTRGSGEVKAQVVTQQDSERHQLEGERKLKELLDRLRMAVPELATRPYSDVQFLFRGNALSAGQRQVHVRFTKDNERVDLGQFVFDPFNTSDENFELFMVRVFMVFSSEIVAPPLTFVGMTKEQLTRQGFRFFGTGRFFLFAKDGVSGYQLFDTKITKATFRQQNPNTISLLTDNTPPDSVTFSKRGDEWVIVEK
jgi:hypothetical protein